MAGRPQGDAPEWGQQVALVGRFTSLRLDQAEQRGHGHERDDEVDHDADGRPDAERTHRDDVAGRKRQHPGAVVALAPRRGAVRCATVLVNACSTSPCRRSSSQCCMMCTSSAIARTTMSGTIMLARTLKLKPSSE